MIRYYHWDSATDTVSCALPSVLPKYSSEIPDGTIIWIDLENPTPEEEAQVFRDFLPVHPLTLEDITRPRRLEDGMAHLPKVEEFPTYLYVVANPLPMEVCNPDKPSAAEVTESNEAKKRRIRSNWIRPQLNGILTHNILITHHYDELPCVNQVRGYVDRRAETTGRGPDYLFHLVLDEMVDEYAPVVERFGEQLDRIEIKLFAKPSPQILKTLLRLKRQVVFLRKTLILEREVLARLVRGEFDLVKSHEIVYYRNVYDHLVRYTELIEGAREMVSDLMQTHLAAASNRLNEVMKALTVISLIGAVCTLIAGIYGMNFEHMPELKWAYGYPFALSLMATVVVVSLAAFRWKKWI